MKRYKSPHLENEKRKNPDRRKQKRRDGNTEYYWSDLVKEISPELKNLLQHFTEKQMRMAELEEQRAQAEIRMSESFAGLVEHFKSGIPVKVNVGKPARKKSKKSDDQHHQKVKEIILRMRKQNETYQDIAEYLDRQGIPTFTKRGKWHAQTVHRLYQDYEGS